jgi:hypothetical protein
MKLVPQLNADPRDPMVINTAVATKMAVARQKRRREGKASGNSSSRKKW